MPPMRVSAKADYAVRAAVELATQPPEVPVGSDQIALSQDIPLRFLENILYELRQHDLVERYHGVDGGYFLARPSTEITVAEVIGAVDGPVAAVHGERPDALHYRGSSASLQGVWLALRANVRLVLESVTLADVVAGDLPEPVLELSGHPEATAGHPIEP
jgi:Rrf2 family protein